VIWKQAQASQSERPGSRRAFLFFTPAHIRPGNRQMAERHRKCRHDAPVTVLPNGLRHALFALHNDER
jgi:hypothetical protein